MYITLGDAYYMTGQFSMSTKAYRSSCAIAPDMMYPKYLLVRSLIEAGDSEGAKNMANIVLAMNIKVPTTASRAILTQLKNYVTNGTLNANIEARQDELP